MTKRRDQIGRAVALGLTALATVTFIVAGIPQSLRVAIPSEGERAWLQETFGQVIVSAAMAQTPQEKAQTQEVFGALIFRSASIALGEIPMDPLTKTSLVPPGWSETKGEAAVLIFAAIGGTLMLLISFFGIRSDSAPLYFGGREEI